jgi:phage gp29-like protein
MSGIADVINSFAIPRLMRLNGYTDTEFYPEIAFSDIETPDVNELAGALAGLTASGILTPDDELEKWVREYANLPASEANESSDEEGGDPATPNANDRATPNANDRATPNANDRASDEGEAP